MLPINADRESRLSGDDIEIQIKAQSSDQTSLNSFQLSVSASIVFFACARSWADSARRGESALVGGMFSCGRHGTSRPLASQLACQCLPVNPASRRCADVAPAAEIDHCCAVNVANCRHAPVAARTHCSPCMRWSGRIESLQPAGVRHSALSLSLMWWAVVSQPVVLLLYLGAATAIEDALCC